MRFFKAFPVSKHLFSWVSKFCLCEALENAKINLFQFITEHFWKICGTPVFSKTTGVVGLYMVDIINSNIRLFVSNIQYQQWK